jgi:heat shock protein beta
LFSDTDVWSEEYKAFYKAFFKDYQDPLAWRHFSGDSGAGGSFKAIIYLPSKMYVLCFKGAAGIFNNR